VSRPDLPHHRRWSTAAVTPAQRLDYWIGAISEGFLAMEASSPSRTDFNGELVSAPLGPLGVNLVRADAQRVWRTPRGIARSRDNYAYLLGNLDSTWHVAQDGRESRLAPGDFVLVDSRRPYRFDFDQGPSTVSLELPLDWVLRWVAEPEAHVCRPFRSAEPGWGSALAAFARGWRPEMAEAPPLPAELLTDQLGALLSLACPGQQPATAAPALCRRIAAMLRERLAEPGLGAAEVAGALGVSVRSLHRAMAASGQTFAQVLMAERMAAAQRMLALPALRRVSAAEIGRRVGLLDPSHFARLCRRWLGRTPSQLRGGH
jgi:AraC family transcriptional activator of tynA and feaB